MQSTIIDDGTGIVFIMDPTHDGVTVPDYEFARLATASDTCIAIGSFAGLEGPVELFLTDDVAADLENTCPQRYETVVATPGLRLAAFSVRHELMIHIVVESEWTRVRVGGDDSLRPHQIWVEVKPAASRSN